MTPSSSSPRWPVARPTSASSAAEPHPTGGGGGGGWALVIHQPSAAAPPSSSASSAIVFIFASHSRRFPPAEPPRSPPPAAAVRLRRRPPQQQPSSAAGAPHRRLRQSRFRHLRPRRFADFELKSAVGLPTSVCYMSTACRFTLFALSPLRFLLTVLHMLMFNENVMFWF